MHGTGDGRTSRPPGRRQGDHDHDAAADRMIAALLSQSHLMRLRNVPGELAEAARVLGVSGVQVYLADLQERQLIALAPADGQAPEMLAIDSTLAGRAYQTTTIQSGQPGQDGDAHRLWIPLVDH